MGRYHSPVQALARVVLLVANPITYDGRVRRHASTLAEAGYDVCVLGVVGPNDRDEPPHGLPWGSAGEPTWRWHRLDRRRQGLWPRLRWVTSASRQRTAQYAFDVAQQLAAGNGPAWLDAVRRPLAGLAIATSAPDLAWAAVQERPDLIYANDLDTLPAAAWAAQVCHVPFVYDAHEVYVDEHPALRANTRRARAYAEAHYCRQAAAVLTVNDLIARDLQQRYGLALPAVVRNLPRLSPGDIAKPPAERPMGDPGTLHVLYHGAHIGQSQHGVDDLLRALAHLHAGPTDTLQVRLTLRGGLSRSEEDLLQRRIHQLGIASRVGLAPPVPGAEALVRSALADGADVGLAVHPPLCLSYVYTTSSKVYEYQLAGLGVVASDVPGNRHSIAPGAGLFYPAGDALRLAESLRLLATQRDTLRTMQQAAYQYAQSSLRWPDESQVLLDTIARALQHRQNVG